MGEDTKRGGAGGGADDKSKEAFVAQEDRPEVRLTPDTPIAQLRVRDLTAILGAMAGKNPNFEVGKTSLKDFFDKPFPEEAKDFIKEIKPEKLEKSEIKELKGEKHEKIEKREKLEKPEIKEVKNEKLEQGEGTFEPKFPVPDPRIDQLIHAVSGLVKQVGQLAHQVDELKKTK
jgi:hypothetical protein